jgi:hypothetical protein
MIREDASLRPAGADTAVAESAANTKSLQIGHSRQAPNTNERVSLDLLNPRKQPIEM